MSTSFPIYTISCSIFENIATNNKGSILNANECNVSISQTNFVHITSSQTPGVIYIHSSNVSIYKCYFESCFGNGNDMNYGRTIYAIESNAQIEHYSAFRCAPNSEDVGDSTSFFSGCDIACNFLNFSFCYGSYGSSGIGIWLNTERLYLSYLSITDSKDLFCMETADGKEMISVYKSNFINSTENDAVVNSLTITKFDSCVFQLMPEKFQHHSFGISEFVSCVSDKEMNGITFSTIIKSTKLDFDVKQQYICHYFTVYGNNAKSLILLPNIMVFIFLININS